MTRTVSSSAHNTSGSGVQDAVDRPHALAGMLLAAVLAALLEVAYQLINNYTDGHLLVGWVTLWTLVFAALALMAAPLRQLADLLAVALLSRLQRAGAPRRA